MSNQRTLASKPAFFRYAYFLLSSMTFMTFRGWMAAGEPNPFVRPDRQPRFTDAGDIQSVFSHQLLQVRTRPLTRPVLR